MPRFSRIYRIKLSLIVVLLHSNFLFGAFESTPSSSSNLALGLFKLNSNGNILDIINEPSSIINYNLKGGEVIWNRPFQIKDIQQAAFAAAFPYKNWGFGISANTFGNKIYNESVLTISVAGAFKSRLALGINFVLYQLKITEFGTAHTLGLSASMRYNINANWDWVTTVRNLNSPQIGTDKEKLPQVVSSGFIGSIHEIVAIAAEWEQDLAYDGALKFGILVRPLNQLSFAVGYVSNPGQFTAGLSINYNKIYFEYGTIAHNDLGLFTHQLGIGVSLNRH